MARKSAQIYQIKVSLDNTHPPVWRRIQVSGDTTLLELHDILQIVMGWENYHLHMFTIEGLIYGDPADDEYGDLGSLDEASYKLSQVIYREGQRFEYEYDFGDSWEHTLLLEKILPAEEGVNYPVCIKGKRACPPEDVGGVWGYEAFLEAIRDPKHPEHETYIEWIGGEFHSEAFNLEEVNARLRSTGRGRSTKALDPWAFAEADRVPELAAVPSDLEKPFSDDQLSLVEDLPLRKDMIAMLAYLRDQKVKGTQYTGNFPLKAVGEICAQFVEPLAMEETIGERIYQVRSELEVRPLFFLHVLASVGGLVTGGLGRVWKLTEVGDRFLVSPALLQLWHLIVTWWTQTNWEIASPFGLEEDFLPPGFPRITLAHLLDLPPGVPAPFEPFADRLIEAGRLFWPVEDQESGRRTLQVVIESVVIEKLAEFGILNLEYSPHKTLGKDYKQLSSFQVTPFGRRLLDAIATSYR